MDINKDPLGPILPLLRALIEEALISALKTIYALGEDGKITVNAGALHIGKNSDTVLRADGESELAMLNVLDRFGKLYHIRFIVFGEEVMWQVTGDMSSKVIMTVFLDGIDGTENYKLSSTFDSGPMISICRGWNPTFDDTLIAGTALINTGWIVIADIYRNQVTWDDTSKSKGLHVLTSFSQRDLPTDLSAATLLADDYAPSAKAILSRAKFEFTRTGSTATTIVLLALQGYNRKSTMGLMNRDYPVLVLDECDKYELEQPVLFLVMKILGGIMKSFNGKEFGPRAILATGSNARPAETVLFTLAPTQKLYQASLELIGPYL